MPRRRTRRWRQRLLRCGYGLGRRRELRGDGDGDWNGQRLHQRRSANQLHTTHAGPREPVVACFIDQNGGLNGAQVQTARIVAGQSSTPFNAAGGLEFDPLGVGSTVLTATIPNFTTLPAAGFTVNVTP